MNHLKVGHTRRMCVCDISLRVRPGLPLPGTAIQPQLIDRLSTASIEGNGRQGPLSRLGNSGIYITGRFQQY